MLSWDTAPVVVGDAVPVVAGHCPIGIFAFAVAANIVKLGIFYRMDPNMRLRGIESTLSGTDASFVPRGSTGTARTGGVQSTWQEGGGRHRSGVYS
jgi:hypothetical protein